jgi:hypothetical protein
MYLTQSAQGKKSFTEKILNIFIFSVYLSDLSISVFVF